MATFHIEQPLRPLSRSRTDRWLGGVCGGLARGRGVHPGWVRAAFVAGALVAGVGVLVYLACWLIIPQEGEAPGEGSSGWLVALARACAACLGLAMLAGRFVPIVLALAIAGSLAGARIHARTRATLDTTGPTFAVFLLGVILIVGGLIYLPMLILGPLDERIVG